MENEILKQDAAVLYAQLLQLDEAFDEQLKFAENRFADGAIPYHLKRVKMSIEVAIYKMQRYQQQLEKPLEEDLNGPVF